jgi:hypothetical protein
MKTLLATAFLLGASSLMTAHAEWEILDPGMAVASTATATPTTAPMTRTSETPQRDHAAK